jgi:predicted enzyme related to lactoylglutathione lyase
MVFQTPEMTPPETNMAEEKKAKADEATKRGDGKQGDVPSLFRINIEVGNLEKAGDFYGKLFGTVGRMQAGARCYFTAGPVTLQVVDVSTEGRPHTAAKALYFVVNDLDAIFERAKSLKCLSSEVVHGEPGGQISVRPWGERSFYAEDPWNNPICFVEAGTIYPG